MILTKVYIETGKFVPHVSIEQLPSSYDTVHVCENCNEMEIGLKWIQKRK